MNSDDVVLARTRGPLALFLMLGALSLISPFAIDMYLPSILQMAKDFGTTSAIASLSISVYFIGFAVGQIFYGPFLDRYGRKRPLYVGLTLFILTSIGCLLVKDIRLLIVLRFVQALGGCVAQVAAVVMVRDFFSIRESAKIFSLIFLMIGISPLLAPSIGGLIMIGFGWKWVFVLLAFLAILMMMIVVVFLPEGHQPDKTIKIEFKPILKSFLAILEHPRFYTYAFSGALSFAGLFTYVAGSPIIFMGGFHISAQRYGLIFATLTMGFIGGSQINVALLRKFGSKPIFTSALIAQVLIGSVFLLGVWNSWYGFPETLVLFFAFLSCAGLTYPNAAALALEPFTKNAGSASALLGFLQMGIGALISSGIGIFNVQETLPIIVILFGTSLMGLVVLMTGQKKII